MPEQQGQCLVRRFGRGEEHVVAQSGDLVQAHPPALVLRVAHQRDHILAGVLAPFLDEGPQIVLQPAGALDAMPVSLLGQSDARHEFGHALEPGVHIPPVVLGQSKTVQRDPDRQLLSEVLHQVEPAAPQMGADELLHVAADERDLVFQHRPGVSADHCPVFGGVFGAGHLCQDATAHDRLGPFP